MIKRSIFNNRLLPYLLILPQILVTAAFFYWPAAQGVYQSLMRSDPFGLHNRFIWFDNFVALFTDPLYLKSIGITLVFSASVAFVSISMGLFIATLSRNLGQVVMLVILIMLPLILLSGAWTPPEAMPPALRQAMYLSPLYYYIEMSYGILMKGAGLRILWDSLLGLGLLGGLVFGFGVWRFRRQFG